MTLFFSLLLGVSVVGIIVLIALKRYELTTGRVLLGSLRPKLNRFSHRATLLVEAVLPALITHGVRSLVGRIRRGLQAALARLIVFFERMLERTLRLVREKTRAPQGGKASVFLQEVADHKRKILQQSPPRRIVEE